MSNNNREDTLIKKFLEGPTNLTHIHVGGIERRVEALKKSLAEKNLEPYALRVAKPGESFIPNSATFQVWNTQDHSCYGPRLIVRKRTEKKPPTSITGRFISTTPNITEISKTQKTPPVVAPPFEKRFYNASSIKYETAPGEFFEVFFYREEREVVLIHTTKEFFKTYFTKAHPDDQYDEQFGFELASARLWEVSLGSYERVKDFLSFRSYVWGVKGWGVLGSGWSNHPRAVSTLLAASKEPSFRQRVVDVGKDAALIRQFLESKDGHAVSYAKIQQLLNAFNLRVVDYRRPVVGEQIITDYGGVTKVDYRFLSGISGNGSPYQRLIVVPVPSEQVSEEVAPPSEPRPPELTQEDRWIAEETEDWHIGESAAQRAARIRTFLTENKLKVVGYRVGKSDERQILINGSEKPIETKIGWLNNGKRLIVEPVVESSLDILKRYKETARGKDDKKTAEQLEKHLREQGYVPVAVRDPQAGDKFWWSCYCQAVLGLIQEPWEDDPVLIVAPVPAAKNPDEKPLSFIRQEFIEDGGGKSLWKAEGLLKQYREWGFEPVDYRQVRVGEYYGSAFTGYLPEKRTEKDSYLKVLIFRKLGE